jgi:hypothetical protein
MKPNHQPEVLEMIGRIEQRREVANSSPGICAKKLPAATAVLTAAPEIQASFVQCVVALFAAFGVQETQRPGSPAWFQAANVPWASGEVARLLLQRRLPFSDEALAGMLEQIAGMGFITFNPALEGLIAELEKRAAEGPLSALTHNAAWRVANALRITRWPADEVQNWDLHRAADRKLELRILGLLRQKRQPETEWLGAMYTESLHNPPANQPGHQSEPRTHLTLLPTGHRSEPPMGIRLRPGVSGRPIRKRFHPVSLG